MSEMKRMWIVNFLAGFSPVRYRKSLTNKGNQYLTGGVSARSLKHYQILNSMTAYCALKDIKLDCLNFLTGFSPVRYSKSIVNSGNPYLTGVIPVRNLFPYTLDT